MGRPAVFLDRDGTLIEDTDYVCSVEEVTIRPGVAESLIRLRRAGYELVVVSNQSGVARGMFTLETLREINDHMRRLLARQGAKLDEVICCPYLPGEEATVEEYRRDSELRKPRPGMILQAARERDLDLGASWAVGDSLRDVQAGRAAGCRTVLLSDSPGAKPPPEADFVAPNLAEAVNYILGTGMGCAQQPAEAEAQRSSAGPPGPSPSAPSETDGLLRELLDVQRRQLRMESQGDFSFLSLAGAIVQVVALAFALFGFLAMIDGGEGQSTAALLRLLLAVFCQLLALTLHVQAKRKQ
jgi:D-glycero-D-manno-heptose 1,7-bisphosphate phosphatase